MRLLKSTTEIFCSIFIFLCAGFLTDAKAQGDSLFAKNEFRKAALAYEYEFFNTGDPVLQSALLIKKSECFLTLRDFKKSAATLDRVNFTSLSDSMQRDVHVKLAYSSYLGGEFQKAESHMIRMEAVTDSSGLYPYLTLYSLILNELGNYKEAHQKLNAFINRTYQGTTRDSLLGIAGIIYSEKNLPRLKNVRKAQNLSAFLPGVGQMYAGHFWDGVTSALLVTGSVGFTVYAIVTGNYVTGVIIGYALMSKFYQGGIRHLEYLVKQTNYRRSKEFNETAKTAITRIARK